MDRVKQFDLKSTSVREVNDFLHNQVVDVDASGEARISRVEILNPQGLHSIAVGVDSPIDIDIAGHAGYFIAGMNKQANVTVQGNVGWSVAENMMSGTVRVEGHASESAGASAHGGLLVIRGNASSRCGISLKGADIVVGGSVGHFSAFMAQAGTLVVCGDAGANLGDSLYEATIYVGGTIQGLGADAREEEMQDDDRERLRTLLTAANVDCEIDQFKRVASARSLYHWNVDTHQEY